MHGRPRSTFILACFILPVLSFAALGCGTDPAPAEFPLPDNGRELTKEEYKNLKDVLKDRGPKHERDRLGVKCKQKCVKVEIQSVGLTNDIDETKGPGKARVVAEMWNKHADDTEGMFNLKPGGQYEYYMWVDGGGPSGTARWTVVELEKLKGGTAKATHMAQDVLYRCETDGQTQPSEADFKGCHRTGVQRSGMVLLPGASSLWASIRKAVVQGDSTNNQGKGSDDPAWLRCVNGCCTTAQQAGT